MHRASRGDEPSPTDSTATDIEKAPLQRASREGAKSARLRDSRDDEDKYDKSRRLRTSASV